jgi:hypothetical protein
MSIRKNSEDIYEKTDDIETEFLEIIEEDFKTDSKPNQEIEIDQSRDYEKYIEIVQDTYNQITTYCDKQGLSLCENLNTNSLENFFNTMYSSYN